MITYTPEATEDETAATWYAIGEYERQRKPQYIMVRTRMEISKVCKGGLGV